MNRQESAHQWDVLVLGAGPAGCALARALSPRLRVLLLDREDTPETTAAPPPPRIGESLSGAAAPLLRRLGLYEDFVAQGHAPRGAFVLRWEDASPRWFDPLRDPHGVGWHLDRLRFDRGLRAAALQAGAQLLNHGGVRAISFNAGAPRGAWELVLAGCGGGRSVRHRAPVLVDATGRSMWLSRRWGLPVWTRDRLVCLHLHLPAQASDADHSMQICAEERGWWYSVRVPSGERVVAFHLDAADPELQALRHPKALMARWTTTCQPTAMDPAPQPTLRVHACGAGTALAPAEALRQTPPGLYLIGDALLSADPISSQGLFNALASAHSAAQCIDAELAGNPGAREVFIKEMQAVQARYVDRVRQTYRAVKRYAEEPFWARRCRSEPGPG